MVSDAGEHMVGGVEWTKDGKKGGSEFQVHLSEKEQQSSLTEHEMLGQRGAEAEREEIGREGGEVDL